MVLAGAAPELGRALPVDRRRRRRRRGVAARSRPPGRHPPARGARRADPAAADQRGRPVGVARRRVPRRCAATTGLPLRLLELGASAGLNLRFDRYRYEQDGAGFGRPDSPVRFVDSGPTATPPFDAPLDGGRSGRAATATRSTRRPTTAALTLLSYVWPDQDRRASDAPARRARRRRAASRSTRRPGRRSRSGSPASSPTPRPGVATVVFHSVVWQYLPEPTRALSCAHDRRAAGRATPDAPARLPAAGAAPPAIDFPPSCASRPWPGGDGARARRRRRPSTTGPVPLAA